MKRLIVNADDFGMTPGVNRAIIESHRNGIVTSATLMATGAAFEEAVRLARETPRLSVGCHISLVQTELLVKAQSLALAGGGQPRSRYQGLPDLARAAFSRRLEPAEVTTEARSQIEKLQSAGIQPSHFDTHKHVHLLPPVLRPLLKAARECGVRALRCPFEPPGIVSLSQVPPRLRLWKRLPVVALLRRFRPSFRNLVAQFGLAMPEGTLGISATGCLDEALFKEMLSRLPEGTWEFVCHPAYVDQRLHSLSSLRTGETEQRVLTSNHIRNFLADRGVELITYADLAEEIPPPAQS